MTPARIEQLERDLAVAQDRVRDLQLELRSERYDLAHLAVGARKELGPASAVGLYADRILARPEISAVLAQPRGRK